jgi:threonylcarbamoyladenosine tRNA methylthiotransferase MtaB
MRHTRTVGFHTLGCKLNFSESSTLARSLEDAGYARVRVEERPDVFVLNTCSVTENADKECRRHVRRFQAINPEGLIVVIGCYSQLKPQEIAAIPGVDMVLGANEKFDLASHLDSLFPLSLGEGLGVRVSPIKEAKRFIPSYSANDRTRTFLKVQDGCDYFCSFCTIPLARGRSRSGTIAETLEQVDRIADQGVKEIVLTGVNTGDFGRANNETFLQLIEKLDRVIGIERYRISSIEPNLLTDEIIEFVAQGDRFAPHFHIPLQSGSDVILERMRRRYDTSLYRQRVVRIKSLMPDACVGADVITGTPGETAEEFLKTHEFLRSIPVDYLHVFTYSERANTTAVRSAGLRKEDVVPMEVRRERTKQLRILSSRMQRSFYVRHLATVRPVLFEHGEGSDEDADRMEGYTDNYIRVVMPYDPELVNRIIPVQLQKINGDGQMEGAIAVHESSDILIH